MLEEFELPSTVEQNAVVVRINMRSLLSFSTQLGRSHLNITHNIVPQILTALTLHAKLSATAPVDKKERNTYVVTYFDHSLVTCTS